MRHFNWRAIQAEAVGSLDLDIHQFSDQFVVAFKHGNFVGARPAHQTGRVCFARPLAEDFHTLTDQSLACASRRLINKPEQILVALFLGALIDLISHLRR